MKFSSTSNIVHELEPKKMGIQKSMLQAGRTEKVDEKMGSFL